MFEYTSDFDPSSTTTTLLAGTEYALVGFEASNPTNPLVPNLLAGQYVTADVGPAPQITYNGYQYDYNGSLDLPNISYSPAYFGPNFEFAAAVPLPATFGAGLSCLALFGAFLVSRRSQVA